jgi:hypothetical protein
MVVPLFFWKDWEDILSGDLNFSVIKCQFQQVYCCLFCLGLLACKWMIAIVKVNFSYFSICTL